ncbi:DUF4097 domain-containing protein [Tahibacter amnicola]|uniref:DUF4097 domain-containing protein n=1 Tax=Tahibacter amnicola TaxID=2976241 RepID=A0ABY6BEV9_9GAMM|nr:DUF4097 domain-containing protein [Tahibacter amnicola]UXI68399.1 DUF4097 domain-containing protein [Tahibacter amnicola]
MQNRSIRYAGCIPALFAIFLTACSPPATRREPAPADAPVPPYTVEHVRRDLAVPAGVVRIRIDNPHGSVTIKPVEKPVLGVYETIQRIGEKPEEPQIHLAVEGDEAVLRVAYASDRNGGADRLVKGFRKGRVDLGVFVPAGPELHVTTTYGDVQVRRVNNELVARTREGSLVAAGAGSMDVQTDSGQLSLFPVTAKWQRPLRGATRTGNIVMEVPVRGDIDLVARTRGRFTGPVSLEMRQAPDGRTEGHFKAGRGSQHIQLDSQSGDIHLAPYDYTPEVRPLVAKTGPNPPKSGP